MLANRQFHLGIKHIILASDLSTPLPHAMIYSSELTDNLVNIIFSM